VSLWIVGFKPVTAPPHFASEYYASTPTPPFYKSSTPEYARPNSTPSYESVLKRDPLFQESASSWNLFQTPGTTPRTPKHFLSDDDIAAYRKSVLGTKNNYEQVKYRGPGEESR